MRPELSIDLGDYVGGGFQLFAQIEKSGERNGVSASLAFERILVGVLDVDAAASTASGWKSVI